LPPAHEQGLRTYVASVSATDIQRRRVTAAALAGPSGVIVPPQPPPENPQPALSPGVPSAVEISLGHSVSVIPTVIRDPATVRTEMLISRLETVEAALQKLETVEAALQKIAPFLTALEAAYGEHGQLGHNYPPERIELLPLDTIDIQTGSEVAKLVRAELNAENPRPDVLRVGGLVLNQLAARSLACLSWIRTKGLDFVDAAVKSAGTETGKRLVQAAVASAILNQLHIDLAAIATELLHLVTH
jgi:hypothetical protein